MNSNKNQKITYLPCRILGIFCRSGRFTLCSCLTSTSVPFFLYHQAAPPSSPSMTISLTTATATRVSRGSSAPPTATPTRMASASSASPARCLWAACLRTSTKVNGKTRKNSKPSCLRGAERSCSHCLSVFTPSDEITSSFRRFGHLVVDWPHKAESKSYFPPKGSD